MPNVPDPQRPSEASQWSERWRQKMEKDRLPGAMAASTKIEFAKALSTSGRILSADAATIDADAARLAARHEQHRISEELVAMMLLLKMDPKDEQAIAELQFLRTRANESGFFLMKYTPEMMRERIASSSYVIGEAYASFADPNRSADSPVSVADCQCWIPPIPGNEMIDLPVAGSKDIIFLDDVVQECVKRPWAFGEVKDISSNIDAGSLGYAGAARSAAFHHIENVANPSRGTRPVEFMMASIGNIKGLVTDSGEEIRLRDLGHPQGIMNRRSVAIHEGGSYPAEPAYKLVDRTVPVEMEDGTIQNILLDWLMYVHHLRLP
jgi:hypothetical protein